MSVVMPNDRGAVLCTCMYNLVCFYCCCELGYWLDTLLALG